MRDRSPVVILVHGLGDDRHIPYIQRFNAECHRRGWRPVVFSYWRCDFTESRDLKAVVEHIQRRNPKAPVAAVGYSAGGYLLMRYVATYGESVPLACAITVSGCFDFVKAFECVRDNENPSYNIFLDLQERKVIRRHVKFAGASAKINERIEQTLQQRSGIELYDAVMRLIRPDLSEKWGRDAADHEDRYSLKGQIRNVKVATLVLHALDDPVVNNDHIDWAAIASNPHMIAMHTKRGGHVAFFEGWRPSGPTFSDRACANFIASVIESQSQTNFLVNAFRKSLHDDPDISTPIVNPAKMARISSFATMPGELVRFSMSRRGGGGSQASIKSDTEGAGELFF